MKSIWVIFRLMLLLVVAIRLLKSNKKDKKFAHERNREQINLLQSPYFSQKINTDNTDNILQIKQLFRLYVRPILQQNPDIFKLSIENRLILLVYIFAKQYEKGNLFYFLWYKNEWITAFGQALHLLNLEEYLCLYQQIIKETCHFELNNDVLSSNENFAFSTIFPDGSKEYATITHWERVFSLNELAEKTLIFIQK